MIKYSNQLSVLFVLLLSVISCNPPVQQKLETVTEEHFLQIVQEDESIQVYIQNKSKPVLTQVVKSDFRPYIHPILAPDSDISLTQYSPEHHRHQTGLYWGFTRINGSDTPADTLKEWFYKKDKPARIRKQIGRDYFHNPDDGFWKKIAASVIIPEGPKVRWQTIYHLMDASGNAIMEETQVWNYNLQEGKVFLELEWSGKAIQNTSINKFDYGGLFLRMPWKSGVQGQAVNNARQINNKAEGQRAMWVDVGMEIEGLNDQGHIAIFDHPDNPGFPQHWRVDGQLGVGPVPAHEKDVLIEQGQTITYRHQLVGFQGSLPDVALDSLWAKYVGDEGMYNTAALWGIAQKEGRDAKLLSPSEAVEAMTILDDFTVNAFASEPMITQPMAFCWDDKGRMWIAENRDYESRGHGFSNSGDSRILILEDTDRDGQADKQTVFLENIPFPSAIAVGFDGLYLGAPPNLLFVPDRNHDDKADVDDLEVLLTGWGIRDRHETINSLHWGPDGWLYGLEGFATPSKIRKPLGKGKIYRHGEAFPEDLLEADGIDINGGVWRYHPLKHEFEAVAHGFSNPWGIDYDAKGQLFITACVIPHIFHIIPGGIYQRQGGRHFSPYVYQDIQTIVDHRHRSAHGGARVYLSDAFPKEHHGRLFMANIHEHAVLSDILNSNGSGFTASHGDDFMHANNAQWIGFSMELGPEGGLYVLDWHDADICGKEVIHKETGRVYRIMPTQSLAQEFPDRYSDLNSLTDLALVDLQLNASSWHARRARTILQFRATQKSLEEDALIQLSKILEKSPNDDYRLRALWSLHITNKIERNQLISLLDHKDPYTRAWSIQFLTEDKSLTSDELAALEQLAKTEKSPVVRLYLASALQRIPFHQRWELAQELTKYSEDNSDPNIPHMLWFAIEPLVMNDVPRILSLAQQSKMTLVSQNIARRLVDGEKTDALVEAIEVKHFNRLDLCKGLLAGLENNQNNKVPTNWNNTYDKLQKDQRLQNITTQIAQLFGNAEAAQQLVAVIQKPGNNYSDKRKAIQNLSTLKNEQLVEELPRLLEQDSLRIAAIRAIPFYQRVEIGKSLIENFSDFTVPEKQEILQALSSRLVYARPLANAIKEKSIPRNDVPPYIASQLRRVLGNGFVEIWGPIDDLNSDVQSEYAKYRRLMQDHAIASADPFQGKNVFQRVCWACHKMYGDGGNLGPDLTGSNRLNTEYLLSNILEPSGEIQDDYQMVVITTNEGRTYSGSITNESDHQITMSIVGQENINIKKSSIQSKEVNPQSIMPVGLLNSLTDEEILNLVAFLKSSKPIPEQ